MRFCDNACSDSEICETLYLKLQEFAVKKKKKKILMSVARNLSFLCIQVVAIVQAFILADKALKYCYVCR